MANLIRNAKKRECIVQNALPLKILPFSVVSVFLRCLVLLSLLMPSLEQLLTHGTDLRFLLKQARHILLTASHHSKIIFFAIGCFIFRFLLPQSSALFQLCSGDIPR